MGEVRRHTGMQAMTVICSCQEGQGEFRKTAHVRTAPYGAKKIGIADVDGAKCYQCIACDAYYTEAEILTLGVAHA